MSFVALIALLALAYACVRLGFIAASDESDPLDIRICFGVMLTGIGVLLAMSAFAEFGAWS